MGKVYSVKRQAWYLSKYLSSENFERYHFSNGWVFPGWIGWSKWYKKSWGKYPPNEMLRMIAQMNSKARENVLELYKYELSVMNRKIGQCVRSE